ncbi:DUF6249 domain-containing protein [Ktedonobacter racemifer]|uniref:DUF6249 domain-containing protein n=1 Tax=Ktedonobacter racemifer DSM 44963 TaxID=485913 RepID=D6TN72_KTERA|nr:DUF6249 domain-containing protein [Ktedonobacter racemifer]EFH87222.1 hypothetical protein Krac_8551 [Ktedonobacter racemifer DSM 44963]
MSANVILVLGGWLIALAIFFAFIVLIRYLQHKERMAMISHGLTPDNMSNRRRSRGILRAGLITAMIGVTLTAGLYPIGFFLPQFYNAPLHLGPWLLPGLIPFGVGLALVSSYYLEPASVSTGEERSEQEKNKVIQLNAKHERESGEKR